MKRSHTPLGAYTPGPWKVGAEEPFVYALNDAGTNRFFASVQAGWLTEGQNKPDDARTSQEEIQANARLIAAAPNLLEALTKAMHDPSTRWSMDLDRQVRAALVLATGKQEGLV